MSRRILRFDPPDRFIAGAIGEPGRRVFHLQAIGGGISAAVIVEKSQVAILARRIVEMLKDLSEGGSVQLPEESPPLRRRNPDLAAGRTKLNERGVCPGRRRRFGRGAARDGVPRRAVRGPSAGEGGLRVLGRHPLARRPAARQTDRG